LNNDNNNSCKQNKYVQMFCDIVDQFEQELIKRREQQDAELAQQRAELHARREELEAEKAGKNAHLLLIIQ
jgi:hypothetical protein